MWMLKQAAAGLIGLAAGAVTASGVFALITVLGMIPRMAQITNTAKHIRTYENAIILGGILGNAVDLFWLSIPFYRIFLGLFGLCSGIFVGSLIMSLAETWDVFPVTIRRCRLRVGLSWLVAAMAAGKLIGSLVTYGIFEKG